MFTGMPKGGAISDPGGGPGGGGPAEHEARARSALAGTRFADIRWVAETGSTNADALALARDGAPEGLVLVADHQTAGRGRRDRVWVAPPAGSLLVSVLLRPPAPVAGAVTMAVAVALAAAVEQVAGVSAVLKWPNDLVVETAAGERKLAGLLAEADWPAGSTISGGYRPPAAHDRAVVVVGAGVNVSWPVMAVEPAGGDAELDPSLADVAGIATALNWLGGEVDEVDRVDLLVATLRGLDDRYGAVVRDGPAGLLAEWRRRSATLGRRVRVDLGADDVEGTAVDVTGEGHLVVETLEGARRAIAVGDVVHLRPAD
jgi:BirA family transcriptional regulator, biotin operon repressor / biotin---[acetyl-CoA-carboxylase] ligase